MANLLSNTTLMLALVLTSGCAAISEPESASVWTVSRLTDPVTGASRCVVAAYDRIAGATFSRTGYLYPVVENHSAFGPLVGVSTGGTVRLPSGDIVWRIDERPYRELKAMDNPLNTTPNQGSSPAAQKAVTDTYALAQRIAANAAATATMASGAKAKEMLSEMREGKTLIFAASSAVRQLGIPTGQEQQVGQMTASGLKPIPLNASFHIGLKECNL